MKKPHKYTEVSTKNRCTECNKPIKLNVLSRIPNADKCYCCNNISKGKLIVTRNRFKLGEVVSTKEIDYKDIQKKNRRYYRWKNY